VTLRNAFESVSTEATLAAIRQEQLNPGDTILTSSVLAKKVAEGKFFLGGKAISAGGTLSTARPSFRLANPVGSNKTLYVALLTVYSSVTQQVRYREGATLDTPVAMTPRNWNRRLSPAPTSVAVMQWDDMAPIGGTTLENESRVFNTSALPIAFPVPHEVVEGDSFTVDFQATADQTTTINAYWYEE
jgi:hypothetical protein